MPRKAGFWIKKDGYLAIDVSMDKAKINRQKKIIAGRNKTGITYKPSLGQKWIKSVYIPHLKRRIENQRMYALFHKRHLLDVEKKANALVDEVKKRSRARLKSVIARYKKLYNTNVERSARGKHAFRLSSMIGIKNQKYYGQFYHFILNTFCQTNDYNMAMVSALIIMSFYNISLAVYLVDWGLERDLIAAQVKINKLIKQGYLEKVPKKQGRYVLSIKGNQFIERFDEFYKRRQIEIKKSLKDGNANKKPKLGAAAAKIHRQNYPYASPKPLRVSKRKDPRDLN